MSSEGGAGNGWARAMIASAASSSDREPVLSANAREINVPDRSMTNVTLACRFAPVLQLEVACCLQYVADSLAFQAFDAFDLRISLRMCGERRQQSEKRGQQGEFHLHRCGY